MDFDTFSNIVEEELALLPEYVHENASALGKTCFSGKRKTAGPKTGRMRIREDYSSAPYVHRAPMSKSAIFRMEALPSRSR